jgi:hypothetical protein
VSVFVYRLQKEQGKKKSKEYKLSKMGKRWNINSNMIMQVVIE